jgi:hypothetical protein
LPYLPQIDTAALRARCAELMPHIWAVFKGEVPNARHEQFRMKGKTRAQLKYQVRFGQLGSEQQETVLQELTAVFCKKGTKYLQVGRAHAHRRSVLTDLVKLSSAVRDGRALSRTDCPGSCASLGTDPRPGAYYTRARTGWWLVGGDGGGGATFSSLLNNSSPFVVLTLRTAG